LQFRVVSILERTTEVAAIEFAVAETSAVVFRSPLVTAQVAVLGAIAIAAIFSRFLDAFVLAGV
jgi:hypothetical protein